MKKTFLLFFVCNCVLTFLSLPAAGVPLEVYSIDGPQDPLLLNGPVHELGELVFPLDEAITSAWDLTDQTACFDGSDNPTIPNVVVSMTNLTGIDWYDVHYVSDLDNPQPPNGTPVPGASISNFDGWIGNAGLDDHEEAFKIDSIGINMPLVFESLIPDNIFQAGEMWNFIIQDYILPEPPTPFDSVGIASLSTGYPPSTGSIVAVIPEPATIGLLTLGCLVLLRSRK
jgi:hypothetical protein